MNSKIITFLLFIIVIFVGCNSSKKISNVHSDHALLKFASALIGKYSSKLQSERDTSYFNISLAMTRIWEDRNDGIWLYVEQAVAANKNKPYRQRVYKLNHPSDDLFTSEIYTIKNAKDVIGLQDSIKKRTILSYDKIELKEGCTVMMKYADGQYSGGTQGNSCPSDLRGAKYATTKIKMSNKMLESWDQGFDSSDVQVWGATKGGYIFIKE